MVQAFIVFLLSGTIFLVDSAANDDDAKDLQLVAKSALNDSLREFLRTEKSCHFTSLTDYEKLPTSEIIKNCLKINHNLERENLINFAALEIFLATKNANKSIPSNPTAEYWAQTVTRWKVTAFDAMKNGNVAVARSRMGKILHFVIWYHSDVKNQVGLPEKFKTLFHLNTYNANVSKSMKLILVDFYLSFNDVDTVYFFVGLCRRTFSVVSLGGNYRSYEVNAKYTLDNEPLCESSKIIKFGSGVDVTEPTIRVRKDLKPGETLVEDSSSLNETVERSKIERKFETVISIASNLMTRDRMLFFINFKLIDKISMNSWRKLAIELILKRSKLFLFVFLDYQNEERIDSQIKMKDFLKNSTSEIQTVFWVTKVAGGLLTPVYWNLNADDANFEQYTKLYFRSLHDVFLSPGSTALKEGLLTTGDSFLIDDSVKRYSILFLCNGRPKIEPSTTSSLDDCKFTCASSFEMAVCYWERQQNQKESYSCPLPDVGNKKGDCFYYIWAITEKTVDVVAEDIHESPVLFYESRLVNLQKRRASLSFIGINFTTYSFENKNGVNVARQVENLFWEGPKRDKGEDDVLISNVSNLDSLNFRKVGNISFYECQAPKSVNLEKIVVDNEMMSFCHFSGTGVGVHRCEINIKELSKLTLFPFDYACETKILARQPQNLSMIATTINVTFDDIIKKPCHNRLKECEHGSFTVNLNSPNQRLSYITDPPIKKEDEVKMESNTMSSRHFHASCCLNRIELIAVDSYGNVAKRTVLLKEDIATIKEYDEALIAGLAATMCFLFILIIVGVVLFILFRRRRNKRKNEARFENFKNQVNADTTTTDRTTDVSSTDSIFPINGDRKPTKVPYGEQKRKEIRV